MLRIENVAKFNKLAPSEKVLTLVLAITARDNASELRFDFRADPPSFRLWYWVRDELLELVPPPASVWPEIYEILLSHTKPATGQVAPKATKGKLHPPFPSFPFAGKLPVTYGKKTIEFDILFFRGRTGEHIWVELPSGVDASEAAAEFFKEWNAAKQDGKYDSKRPRKK